jgi:Zn-finger nucleic acid-binding protein
MATQEQKERIMYQCPRCTAELVTVDYEGVEIETCPACQGEWLDADELRQVVQRAEGRFDPQEIAELNAARVEMFRMKPTDTHRMLCPKCPGVKLSAFNYAATSGIILDKCPECGGIWLDHGEIEMVQALLEEWKGYLYQRKDRAGTVTSKLRQAEETADRPGTRSRLSFTVAVLRGFSQ